MRKFTKITSNTSQFSKCFESNKPLEQQIQDWRQTLKYHCQYAFKKTRINGKKFKKPVDNRIKNLINQRNVLLKKNKILCKTVPKSHSNEKELRKNYDDKIIELEETISNLEADENRKKIIERFKKFSENPETINLQEMWKILQQIIPKHKTSIPIAKKNHKGILVSDPLELKSLFAQEYKNRLRNRPSRPDLGDIKQRKELCRM